MKRNILCLTIFAISLAVICLTGCKNKNEPKSELLIGFYNINDSQIEEIKTVVEEIDSKLNLKTKYVTYKKLPQFNRKSAKPDIFFANAGFGVKECIEIADKNAGVDKELNNKMFQSMKETCIFSETKKDTIAAVPVFFDNLEINIEKSDFDTSKVQVINNWNDIEKFSGYLLEKYEIEPIVFPGADFEYYLDLLGAFGEAFDGKDNYYKAVALLEQASKAEEFNGGQVVSSIFTDKNAPFSKSYNYLKTLAAKKYLNKGSKELKNNNINFYLHQRITSIFATKLSYHRTYDPKAIARFSSIYMPSPLSQNNRSFTATTTYSIPTNNNESVNKVIEALLSTEYQEKISAATGLAPVLANCKTPDRQSDDARYWIAATNAPLAGLGHEVNLNLFQQESIIKEINKIFN